MTERDHDEKAEILALVHEAFDAWDWEEAHNAADLAIQALRKRMDEIEGQIK
jgi:hypothetical protein